MMDAKQSEIKDQLAATQKQWVKMKLINVPSLLAVGVGLFGMFSPEPGSLHPILDNTLLTMSLLVVGVILSVISSVQEVRLKIRKKQLEDELAQLTTR